MQTALSSFRPPAGETGNPGLWHHLLDEVPMPDPSFRENRFDLTLHETAFVLARAFLGNQIPDDTLREIIRSAFSADAFLMDLAPADLVLELIDGPTGSYCDFGARFAAGLLGWRYRDSPDGFDVVAALQEAQRNATISALTEHPCRAVFLEPGHSSGSAAAPASGRWTVAGYGEDFHDCERLIGELPETAATVRPLATLREDGFPWVLGLAIALQHACNQIPEGVKPTFVIPASCTALHAAVKLLERLGLPLGETLSTSAGDDESDQPHHLTAGEGEAAVRELKALYNYDCCPDGAVAWRVAQIWRGSRLGAVTIAVIPFAPGDRDPGAEFHAVNLGKEESASLEWLRTWAELSSRSQHESA